MSGGMHLGGQKYRSMENNEGLATSSTDMALPETTDLTGDVQNSRAAN